MGVMTFRVPADLADAVADDLPRTSVAGGHDRAPTPTHAALEEGILVLDRDQGESGPVYVPWDVRRVGHVVTPTTTLMERVRPYHLSVELARGKINQVRNQYADWQGGGLSPSPDVEAMLKGATARFGQALLDAPAPAADATAADALAAAFDAADVLTRTYQEQVFKLRHARQAKFDTAFGCRLATVPPRGLDDACRLAFNTVTVPLTWRSIEPTESNYQWEAADAVVDWAASRNLKTFAGPLIDFSEAGLPDYVRRGNADTLTLKSLICDFVETVVTRYRGKIARWTITAGGNGSSVMGLSEEELVRLTAMAADAAWQIDSGLQIVFGLAQPWGDYLGGRGFEYSGFVFADTLIRAGLPFAGIELEWFFGTAPRGSFCRDPLEASRLLDLFGLLGVPVQLALAYPSSRLPDPQADVAEQVESGGVWHDFSSTAQSAWASAFASIALCKSYVNGIVWDHLADADPHRIPNAGLVDSAGQIKPAFDRLRDLRETHLR